MSADQPNEMFQPFVEGDGTDLEEFDPFQVGSVSPTAKDVSNDKSRLRMAAPSGGSAAGKGNVALPPRMDIKFKIHEEISSKPDNTGPNEGSSTIFVEGIVMVSKSISTKVSVPSCELND
jgi:hypothetical protein